MTDETPPTLDATPEAPLGAALRAWREYRGLSLADVTIRADLGPARRSWLSRVETGIIRTVSRDRLQALAKALEAPYHALRAGNRPPADAAPITIAPPPGSFAARRRTSSQAKTQQTIEELRDDVRSLSERLDDLSGRIDSLSQHIDGLSANVNALMQEVSTVNVSRAASSHWYPPEPALNAVVGDTPRDAPPDTSSDALTNGRKVQPPIRPPHADVTDLRSDWRGAIELIESQASQGSARSHDELSRILIGRRPVTVHQQTKENFARSMAALDALAGDRCLVLDGISECFVPLDAHKERGQALVQVGAISQLHFSQIIQSRAQRGHALETLLSKPGSRVRDLYTWQAIERLVARGHYALDDRFAALGARPLTNPEVLATLTKLIGFIEGFHDTYEARFIDDSQPAWPCYWMVKEGAYLLIELWVVAPESDGKVARRDTTLMPHRRAAHWATHANSPFIERELEIHDTQTARLFQRYFMEELWHDVPADGRDRTKLIRRLNDLKKKVTRRAFSMGG